MRDLRIIFLFVWMLSLGSAYASLDSLKQALATARDRDQIVLLQEISYQSLFLQPDSAYHYALRSLQLAEQARDDSLVAESQMMIGFTFLVQGNNDAAADQFQIAAELHQQRRDEVRVAAALSNLASAYQKAGQLEASLAATLRALDLFQQHGDTLRYASLLGNAGSLANNLRRLEDAKAYIRESRRLLIDLGQIRMVGNTHNQLGLVLVDQDSLAAAKAEFLSALQQYELVDDPWNRTTSYNSLGYLYQLAETLDSARHYYQLAYDLASDLENAPKQMLFAANIAECYLYDGNDAAASRWMDTATRHRDSGVGELSPLETYYHIAATEAIFRRDLPAAYHYMRLADHYRDSLLNNESQRALAEMEVRFETAKKDQELAEQALELAESERREAQYRLWGGLGLIALLAGIAVWRYRSRLQQEKVIQAERLHQQQLRLQSTVQTQEEERARLSRDLHDGIGQLLSSIRMKFGAFPQAKDNPEYRAALVLLDDACREVRAIAHTMMPRSLEEVGLSGAIEEMLENTLSGTALRYTWDQVGSGSRLPQQAEVNLYRMVQELVQNVLKHAQATEVSVQMIRRSDRLMLLVEDDGIGLPEEATTDGHGMANLRTRAEAIGAEVSIQPGPRGGTMASIRYKLSASGANSAE